MSEPLTYTSFGCPLTVQVHSFWHAGGGLGGDFGADAVVRKEDGLPILPGRHLLGLIAHKLEFLAQLPSSPVSDAIKVYLCGQGADGFDASRMQADDDGDEADEDGDEADEADQPSAPTRFDAKPGALVIDTARMDSAWQAQVTARSRRARDAFTAPFYRRFGMTRLKDGVADDHTLRHVEVTVPMTLTTRIGVDRARVDAQGPDDAAIRAALTQAIGLVQHVGRHRTRGLGRARLLVNWEVK